MPLAHHDDDIYYIFFIKNINIKHKCFLSKIFSEGPQISFCLDPQQVYLFSWIGNYSWKKAILNFSELLVSLTKALLSSWVIMEDKSLKTTLSTNCSIYIKTDFNSCLEFRIMLTLEQLLIIWDFSCNPNSNMR